MRLRPFRIPAAILVIVMFSMTTCELLQAQTGPATPSCHAASKQEPEPKPESNIKFCCETGLIPNKTPIYSDLSCSVVLEKFQHLEDFNQPILFSSFIEFHTGPTSASLISPLRI
jgi:hypothetical protein